MKKNSEIRKEAWSLMWHGRWFWRYLATYAVMMAIVLGAMGAVAFAYSALGVETLQDFKEAQLAARRQGLEYAAPSMRALWGMISATGFERFISFVFSGILAFGMTSVVLQAVRGEKASWFRRALAGFGNPFGMFLLMLRLTLGFLVWMMLAVLPMVWIIPRAGADGAVGASAAVACSSLWALGVMLYVAYRYRAAWFLKVDHPDWGAWECVRRSVELMDGAKRAAFGLDCSYWLAALPPTLFGLLPLVPCMKLLRRACEGVDVRGCLQAADWAALGLGRSDALLLAVAVLGGAVSGVILWVYLVLGHAVFYREQVAAANEGTEVDDGASAVG